MKTLNTLFTAALLFIATLGFSPTQAQSNSALFNLPEGYEVSQNWLQTWKNSMGQDAAARWMFEQNADEAVVLEADNSGSFILVSGVEPGSVDDMLTEIEDNFGSDGRDMELNSYEMILMENHCSMSFTGSLFGQEVDIKVIRMNSGMNEALQIVQVSTDGSSPADMLMAADQIAMTVSFETPATMMAANK